MKIFPKKPRIYPESGNINVRKRAKFGIDPTGDRLHLGHLVPLLVVKRLMKEKKDVRIVLGTFTATLGDPTGQNQTRPILKAVHVEANAALLKKQIIRILGDVNFYENGDVYFKGISAGALIDCAAQKFTVQELMARENFKERPVGLHELLVPLLQAMDSVIMLTEIEVGGEDQLINFSLTRKLQEIHGQSPQVCYLTPIISGTDGKKMSKSSNNCIYLDEPSELIKEKILRIPDSVMDEWLPLFISDIVEAPDDPRERKIFLASEILSCLGTTT